MHYFPVFIPGTVFLLLRYRYLVFPKVYIIIIMDNNTVWPGGRPSVVPVVPAVVHAGWLWKSGASVFSRWRRRWCVLRGQTLLYYMDEAETQLKGRVEVLPGVRIDLDMPADADVSMADVSMAFVGIETSTTRARSGSRFGRRPSMISLKRARPTLRVHSQGRDYHFEAAGGGGNREVVEDVGKAARVLKQWCVFLRRASMGEFTAANGGGDDAFGADAFTTGDGNSRSGNSVLRSHEQLAESEATKAVGRQLRGLESLDVIPQLCEKSRNELEEVERKIRREVRNQAITFKQVTDAVSLIDYGFQELESNVQHTRDLCTRQHENLVSSAVSSKLSAASSRSDGIRSSLGLGSIAAAKRSKIRSRSGRGAPNNYTTTTTTTTTTTNNNSSNSNTMSIIERVAFAKNNLSRTLSELDMYRRVPRTVSELCAALDQDPVQHLPRAHFEYRKLVSWFDGPYHEWKHARNEYLLAFSGGGGEAKADGRGSGHVIARGVRLLAEDESQRERVDGVVGELHKQVHRLGDAWQAAMWEVLGPRVFELAHSRPGGVVLAAQIVETAYRQNQILSALEARLKGPKPSIEMLEEFQRRRRFFGGEDFRAKCTNGLLRAAKSQFRRHMQQGMRKWAKANEDEDDDKDSDDSEDDSGDSGGRNGQHRQGRRYSFVRFEKYCAGLNTAAVGLLNDILPLSRCFPPWYDVATQLVNVHVSCIIAAVAPGGWDKAGPKNTCLCPEWERTGPNEAMYATVGHDGLHLDNGQIITLSRWVRERASNWPQVLERIYEELRRDSGISKAGEQMAREQHQQEKFKTFGGHSVLTALADDLTSHYIRRMENQILQWMIASAKTEELQVEFTGGTSGDGTPLGLPHTPAPRDLTSLLDTKFGLVLEENALSAVEIVRFAIHIVGIVGAYHQARMDSLSWLIKESSDARLVILCAFINDCDQLQTWTDDFVDQVVDSDWVERAMDLQRGQEIDQYARNGSMDHADTSSSGDDMDDLGGGGGGITGRKNARSSSNLSIGTAVTDGGNSMDNLTKNLEDLENTKFEKMRLLRNGQRDLSRTVAATVFSTLLGNRKPFMNTLMNDAAVTDLFGNIFGKLNRDLKKFKLGVAKVLQVGSSKSDEEEGADVLSDSEEYEAPVFADLYTRGWVGNDIEGLPQVEQSSTTAKNNGTSATRRKRSGPERFATETACLTMRDYMIGSSPNVFSMLGEDSHPDLLALIVQELLRLVGREFCERRFLLLNKKLPGVKQALALPASVMADRLFEDIDQLREFFEQLRDKIGPRGLRRHPVDLDAEFGVHDAFGTSTGRVTLLADLLEIEQLIDAKGGGGGGDGSGGGGDSSNSAGPRLPRKYRESPAGREAWRNLFRRMRAASRNCHGAASTASAEGGTSSGMCLMDPTALLRKAVDLRSAKIPRRALAEFENAVNAYDWDGESGSEGEA